MYLEILFGLLILLIIIGLYVYFKYQTNPSNSNSSTVSNILLTTISKNDSWMSVVNNVVNPYNFNLKSNTIEIVYSAQFGAYKGLVNFMASYKILSNNTIQITPTTLISSGADGYWPKGSIWTLKYISSTQLILNDGKNNITLIPFS